jgi:hypothetical protein
VTHIYVQNEKYNNDHDDSNYDTCNPAAAETFGRLMNRDPPSSRENVCQPRNSPKPFSEFAVHWGTYGKVSRSSILSFLSYIDHGVAAICQFVEIRRHRGS